MKTDWSKTTDGWCNISSGITGTGKQAKLRRVTTPVDDATILSKLEGIYIQTMVEESTKPTFDLIAFDITGWDLETDAEPHGICNYRIDGEHLQLRF